MAQNIQRIDWIGLAFNFLFMLLSILLIVFFRENEILTFCLMLVITFIGLLKWRTKIAIAVFAFFGLLFGFAEMIIGQLEVWAYAGPSMFIAPLWLFVLWGNSALFIYHTSIALKKAAADL